MFWDAYFGMLAAMGTLYGIVLLIDKIEDKLHDFGWRMKPGRQRR